MKAVYLCIVICALLGLNSSLEGNNPFIDKPEILSQLIKKEVFKNIRNGFKKDDVAFLKLNLSDGIIQANIDDFADKIVVNVRNLIAASGYDTVSLPDESGIKLKPTGKLNLVEGSLSGLKSMQRYEHATVLYDGTIGKKLSFGMILRFTEIDFIYKYHTKILFVSSTGHLHGKIEKLKLRINLGFNFETYQAYVDDVDVKETGTIDVWLSGNKAIDWFSNSVIKMITSLLHPVILNIVTKAMNDPINDMVVSINEAISNALHPSMLTIDVWLSGNKAIDWFSNSVIKMITSLLHPVILNIVTKAMKDPITDMVVFINEAISNALHPSML